MKNINNDIKTGQLKNCYLLCGEEAYLRRLYKNRLKSALVADGDNMNFSYFEGKDISVSELIDLAETLPFFATHRLLLVENSGFFKSGEASLAEYLPKVPETTCFVFVEAEVDKRCKLYKTVSKIGRVAVMNKQKDAELERWVLGILKKENKRITKSALSLFFSMTGSDMNTISNELEKLLSYCIDSEVISEDAIRAVCCAQTPDQIFKMIDAIAAKQSGKAVALYYDLLAQKEPPLRILALLTRQFRILLKLKDMKTLGLPYQDILSRAGIPPFAAKAALRQTENFTIEQLKDAFAACGKTEEDIKTGRITDRMGVELLIVTFSN